MIEQNEAISGKWFMLDYMWITVFITVNKMSK